MNSLLQSAKCLRMTNGLPRVNNLLKRTIVNLPANEPATDLSNPDVRARVQEELDRIHSKVEEIPLVVGGKQILTSDTHFQVAPYDHQKKIAKYHYADKKILEDAIEGAIKARENWERMPFNHRAAIFSRAADLIATKYRYETLAATMTSQAKNLMQADIDAVAETIDFLKFNVSYAKNIYSNPPPLHQPDGIINSFEYRGLEGFVAAISPFNFTAIGANLATAAALMGNVTLWKPTETAMLSAWSFYKVLLESGLPDDVVQFVPSHGPLFGDVVTASPHLAGVSFTGSASTFKHIWQQVAINLDKYKNFPRLIGECGGKNYHFFHETADIDSAVRGTVMSGFEYSGQKCSACSRIYVPDNLWPEVKDKLIETTKQVKLGNAEDHSTYLSAVIDEKSFDKINSYLELAKNSPDCKVLVGGGADKSVGYYVEPTIIETTNPNHKILQEEIFGPVIAAYVYPHKKWREALKLANETSPYGLTGSIFGSDRRFVIEASQVLRHSAGNFYINDKSTGSVVAQQPFGGARMSGTNDKAGMGSYLMKWVSPQAIKERLVPLNTWDYDYMKK